MITKLENKGKEKATPVQRVINELICKRLAASRLKKLGHDIYPVAIGEAEGEALRTWVIKEKAVQTIEIGLAYGISALYICDGLKINKSPKIRHTVIDPYQGRFKNRGLQSLKKARVMGFVE
jgi:predicted O-methyltransferase YrrM